jgi:hypothetical protein
MEQGDLHATTSQRLRFCRFGDVRVGTIGIRVGVPVDVDEQMELRVLSLRNVAALPTPNSLFRKYSRFPVAAGRSKQ